MFTDTMKVNPGKARVLFSRGAVKDKDETLPRPGGLSGSFYVTNCGRRERRPD